LRLPARASGATIAASAMCLAIPGKITEIGDEDALYRMGRVDFDGVVKNVSLACVPEAAMGDYVLVHVGVALSVIDATDAAQVLADLRRLDDIDAALASREPPP
jgi:hydrogenase expression/formation protein HypC